MSHLAHDRLILVPLASGSRGNCTFIGDERSGVLIDCGLSTRQIERRMDAVGLRANIEAVLVTHEHADHVGAARRLSDRLVVRQGEAVPFYMTMGTRNGLPPQCVPTLRRRVHTGQSFRIGRFEIEPFAVPHDTVEPCGYAVSLGATRAAVVTDLGRPTRLVETVLAQVDLALIEFNHDLQMLLDGSYPWSLKARVKGPHGHLSNAQGGELLRAGAEGRLRKVALAHLSEENNRPEVALEAAHAALGGRSLGVTVALQDAPSERLAVDAGWDIPTRRTRVSEAPRDDAHKQMGLFGRVA